MLYNAAYARRVLQAAQRVNARRALSLCLGRAAARMLERIRRII